MSPRNHTLRTTLALTMALGAIAPAAQARLAEDPAPQFTAATTHDVKSAQDLRRSGPTSSLAGSVDPRRHVITVSNPNGFDWGDAAIGAAGGLGLALAAVGGTLVVTGRRRDAIQRQLVS